MVRTSGIRKKFRSSALNKFLRDKSKSSISHDVELDSDNEDDGQELEINVKSSKSLLSILPKPKNGNAFGPSVNMKELLKMPERAKQFNQLDHEEESVQVEGDDGIVEFDVRKILTDPLPSSNPAHDEPATKVIIPKGKEKQKNQITYLAQLSKATEMERKEQAAQGKFNKAAARAKYGW